MARLNADTLPVFLNHLAHHTPGIRVTFKDESTFMKVLGFLTFPFNPAFMTGFITTIGSTIYFPSRGKYGLAPTSSFGVIAHEFVHIWDSKKRPVLYELSYLFPQVLLLVPLAVFAVLAGWHSWLLLFFFGGYVLGCWAARKHRALFWLTLTVSFVAMLWLAWLFTGWLVLLLVGALVFVPPWPARWRVHWELRGYSMTVAVNQWVWGNTEPKFTESISDHFTNGDYYFMSRNRGYINRRISVAVQESIDGSLQQELPYRTVHDFLAKHHFLHRVA